MRKGRSFYGAKRCLSLTTALIVFLTSPVFAVDISNAPDVGTIADSVKERQIPTPPQYNVRIEVNEGQQEAHQPVVGPKVKVTGFHITGQSIYSEDKLQELVKDSVGKELTLAELKTVAANIAQYFRNQGYMVANAYIPAQDIRDGSVQINVVPGKYGSMDLRNHSRLSNKAAERFLSSIKSGNYVKKDVLERTLLLLSDIGGVSIKASLAPGKAVGTTDLIVEINDTDVLTSQFSMDNHGNKYTGQDLRNLSLNFNNVRGIGDLASISVTNTGGDIANAALSYTAPIGDKGARLGVKYSQLRYALGKEFEILEANGQTKIGGLYWTYPVVRSRNHNRSWLIAYDHRKIEDRIDQYSAYTDKSANVLNLGLYDDSRDKFHGGGINSFALNLYTGKLAIDGGQDLYGIPAQTVDDETAQTTGTYTKALLNFNRLQYLNNRLNLYLRLTGQVAGKNLDSSEKLYLGGADGVRAYPQGEAEGDQGYLLTAEIRYQTKNPGLQLAAFIDTGHVTVNKNTWTGAGVNSRTLSGAGLGLIYSSRKEYNIRVDYAWKLGSEAATADTEKKGRLWLRGVRYF